MVTFPSKLTKAIKRSLILGLVNSLMFCASALFVSRVSTRTTGVSTGAIVLDDTGSRDADASSGSGFSSEVGCVIDPDKVLVWDSSSGSGSDITLFSAMGSSSATLAVAGVSAIDWLWPALLLLVFAMVSLLVAVSSDQVICFKISMDFGSPFCAARSNHARDFL